MRKRFATVIVKNVSMIVLVAGAAVTAVGAGMIYLPAGLITGGVLARAGAVVAMFGEEDDR